MAREYHWVMTVQWPNPGGGGFGLGTAEGVMTVSGDLTRQGAFQALRKSTAKELNAPEGAQVVFFSIERETQL
ncbi:hypothetical protein [Nocardia fluminea]|uniref:Uncharacterized protein n=1 Tax=Nocardia fluminea TaxID=134984 RepID=A0A2N3VGY3_9NOCA|nr:hypothetical protein [Nocardia fluminea]PKV80887.1 hypothetical protein ATK86_5324 [Nocardia fluminea]